jgi:hypothetical protein
MCDEGSSEHGDPGDEPGKNIKRIAVGIAHLGG